MGVYELSGAGGLISGRTEYKSMNAGNMYGAMVPLGFATNNTNFTNIPQNYQDLVVVVFARDTRAVANETMLYGVNGDTSGLYSSTWLYGTGAGVASTRLTGQGYFPSTDQATGSTATAGVFGTGVTHILNYASTSTFKTFLSRGGGDLNGSGEVSLTAGLYRSTNAITSLQVITYEGLVSGSTIALYGIRAVSS